MFENRGLWAGAEVRGAGATDDTERGNAVVPSARTASGKSDSDDGDRHVGDGLHYGRAPHPPAAITGQVRDRSTEQDRRLARNSERGYLARLLRSPNADEL